jgi:hypothetical protein
MRESYSLLNNLENFDKVFTLRSDQIILLLFLIYFLILNLIFLNISNDSDFHQNHMTISKILMNDAIYVSIYDINRY